MAKTEPVVEINSENYKQVMKQKLPVVLMLFDGSEGRDKPLEDAVNRAAKKYKGEAVFGCLDTDAHPEIFAKYDDLELPAVVTLGKKGFFGRKTKSYGEGIRPADLRAHVDYLLGNGPEPEDEFDEEEFVAKRAKKKRKKGGAAHVTDSTFKKVVLKSDIPVLVDFWAEWCGPCRALAPFIDEMADEYRGRVKIVKLDTDANPMMKMQYQVTSIPTLIIFKDGEIWERRTGGTPQVIREVLDDVLYESQ
ncbi:MAG: thioredoxin [Chloroflexi bacterium]|nr:MAG: thioredoxin [Chloroflexota bacterium]